jgi:hypothetical protein
MSKRLQVLVPEPEYEELRRIARRHRLSVGEWVRQALRAARDDEPKLDPGAKLKAVRHAAGYSFPAGDIGEMLAEIERGYTV